VTVVGHTDSTGAETYNESLSLRRAEAVKSELALRACRPP
jgi:outer membrane protein OmpA-like peptidoglycan-associated protein